MLLSSLLLAPLLAIQPTPAAPAPVPATPAPPSWTTAEAPLLSRHLQLTFPDRFLRAGEAYFDHASPPRWIVFQAVEQPAPGTEPSPHYAMFIAELARDPRGTITGLARTTRLSPDASANTCGWFIPNQPNTVLFGSTLGPPTDPTPPGFSRDRQRYSWQFPSDMQIVRRSFTPGTSLTEPLSFSPITPALTLPNGPGYAAECSFSPDGRHLLYTYRDPQTQNPDIWVFDSRTNQHTPLVTTKGYNGGPFFSPDGRMITYRSDRRGDSNLQLYVAELAFADKADPARITGLAREHQITDNTHVNWAPFWHPSSRYLVYTSSAHGHDNYEIRAVELALGKPPALLRTARITNAQGFDGLPAFNADASLMMWTAQRGTTQGELRGTSQLWLAQYTGEPRWEEPEGLVPATPTNADEP
jgi:TolB protein